MNVCVFVFVYLYVCMCVLEKNNIVFLYLFYAWGFDLKTIIQGVLNIIEYNCCRCAGWGRDLSYNQITSLSSGVFNGLANLRTL